MYKENFLNSISPSVRLICSLLTILLVMMAKSTYLVLSLTIFILILVVLSGKRIELYVKFLKNIFLFLLIILALYIIIICKYNILDGISFFYKIILVSIVIRVFELNTNFEQLHSAIYGLIYPFKILDTVELSYKISMVLCFVKYLIESREDVIYLRKLNAKSSILIRNYFKIIVVTAINKIIKKEESLKINHYNIRHNKTNIKSIIVLFISVCFFVICILKEVVL